MADISKGKVTAGLRGAGWNPARMATPFTTKPFSLSTADDQRTLGLLYSRTGQEKTVVCLMHPREFTGTPYLVPDVLDAGCAAWVQAPRSPTRPKSSIRQRLLNAALPPRPKANSASCHGRASWASRVMATPRSRPQATNWC